MRGDHIFSLLCVQEISRTITALGSKKGEQYHGHD